jgi:hypothetical protein
MAKFIQPCFIDLKRTDILIEHFAFIHENSCQGPVCRYRRRLSLQFARDYAGMKGLIKINKLTNVEQQLAASESFNSNFL